MTVVSIDSFMNLEHESVTKWFHKATLAIVSTITVFELIMGHGPICQAKVVSLLLETRLGIRVGEQLKATGSGIRWARILIALAFICYLISVLVENKHKLKNSLLNKVRQLVHKLSMRTSQVTQDPEHGEEIESMPDNTQARVAIIGLDKPVSSLMASVPTTLIPKPAVTTVFDGTPRIIQVAAYQPSSSLEPPASGPEGATTSVFSPSNLEGMKPQARLGTEQMGGNGERPGESRQETSWKISFLLGIISFILCLLFAIADMKNGLAVAVSARLTIIAYYCLPFYWVILVEECYQVSKRIARTWLAEYLSIYYD